MFANLSQSIAESAVRPLVIDALMNVPGLPPILQAIHILSISIIVVTAGFIHLRMLHLALPSQRVTDLFHRLLPGFLGAVGVALFSGMPLIVARPDRYFYNPVAGWKLACFSCATFIFVALLLQDRARPGYWEAHTTNRWIGGLLSLCALSAWVGTILAGRWIAYVDYLFWE